MHTEKIRNMQESNARLDYRAYLKTHTAALHQQLDESPLLRALLQPGLTRTSYARTLHVMLKAHCAVEPLMLALEPSRPAPLKAYQSRQPLLKKELDRLGVLLAPDNSPTATISQPTCPGNLYDDPSYYLGMRYVLEGATQGSRFIYRSLMQHNPQLGVDNHSYWATLAADTSTWQAICQQLAPGNARLSTHELLAGATLAFNLFINTFSATQPDDKPPRL